MYDAALIAQILEILVGRKVKTADGIWHVYDANDVEISDPGGVLWRGNVGALLMWPNEPIEQWLTEQGVAGNLARNLRKTAVQGCRVQTSTDPVPAGSNCVSSVRATSTASAVTFGSNAGSAVATSSGNSANSPSGWGVDSGAGSPCDVCTGSLATVVGYGLRVGGARVRAVASAVSTFSSSYAVGGYQGTAQARGVKNPTDEELLAIAATMFQKAA
tara:strand:+ start:564 stop:1214 length:651 start_codon:yes stop_codon:yes gene_type:complete